MRLPDPARPGEVAAVQCVRGNEYVDHSVVAQHRIRFGVELGKELPFRRREPAIRAGAVRPRIVLDRVGIAEQAMPRAVVVIERSMELVEEFKE